MAQLARIAIERRRSDDALRESESRFRGLFDNVVEGVYQVTMDGYLLSANPALVSMLGYASIEELRTIGSTDGLYVDPALRRELIEKLKREGKLVETDVVFRDDRHLMQIIERIVSSVGRRIDESSPMVDARLADGSRVNAIIPPLALDGPAMSIRRFRTDRLGAEDLVGRESWTEPMMEFLRAAIGCRLNLIVSGGTGAGKTTLLNILSSFIGPTERIVTIAWARRLSSSSVSTRSVFQISERSVTWTSARLA